MSRGSRMLHISSLGLGERENKILIPWSINILVVL